MGKRRKQTPGQRMLFTGVTVVGSMLALVGALQLFGSIGAGAERLPEGAGSVVMTAEEGAEWVRSTRGVPLHGPRRAAVTVHVFSDIECPVCQRYAGIPEQAVDGLGGVANLAHRHFPLPGFGERAKRQHVAAYCVGETAGEEAYFVFLERMFDESRGGGRGPSRSLFAIADLAGADRPSLTACMEDPASVRQVESDVAAGRAIGVRGTPTTVIVNNRSGAMRGLGGLQDAAALSAAIEAIATE
ncbi:protein-disulfide isomerase [Natronocella acetinitrilica]|uniref:Protein-disulfide isomerase n=1 Tax=Natronocella acetinitrilica TaxID=414046 RepID=A0AAE3G3P7_9GAMM|nr:thioredoxin domain-containing protein [Natronocella acetinitrilica]MCP1674156.1 protein-disulfide isomerase [Natronocella acetinitrilica]